MGGRQLCETPTIGAVYHSLMANDWLAGRRTEVAAEAILDAADRLFADPALDPLAEAMAFVAAYEGGAAKLAEAGFAVVVVNQYNLLSMRIR